jgi:hypothetical protein
VAAPPSTAESGHRARAGFAAAVIAAVIAGIGAGIGATEGLPGRPEHRASAAHRATCRIGDSASGGTARASGRAGTRASGRSGSEYVARSRRTLGTTARCAASLADTRARAVVLTGSRRAGHAGARARRGTGVVVARSGRTCDADAFCPTIG